MSSLFGALRLPGAIILGCGQRRAIGAMVSSYGSKVLICTDSRLANGDVINELIEDLESRGIKSTVYGETPADLPLEGILQCVREVREFAPNLIIGIGGGSCMDMAKVVALLLSHSGDIDQFYGENLVPGPILPVIAVPTTAGTGSEVTPIAVVGDTKRELKIGISSPYLIPRAAICDPELTLSCPPILTACSGADALTHAIEAYTARARELTYDLTIKSVAVGKNALTDSFALLAIRNIWKWLGVAYRDGSNVEAREAMMLASLAAGCAFGTAGVAAAHAIQYPVGNDTHTAHGIGVSLLLPYVMEYNRKVSVEPFAEIARAVGLGDAGAPSDELSKLLIDGVSNLLSEVGIPKTLKELGLSEDRQNWTAESALAAARLVNNNPRKLELQDMQRITRAAYSGDREELAR